jgi:hypothetical protein
MLEGREIAADLRRAVDEGVELILAAPEERSARRPAGGGWCAREVIGHLIDSACNNHRRFVINQSAETMIIDPYDQDAWVARQRYAAVPAARLAALWAVYNRHIADVLEAIPPDVLARGRGPLAAMGVAYITTADSVGTIGHLAADYVAHLRQHLEQLRKLLAA